MRIKIIPIIIFSILVLVNITYGATIHGIVYDMSLNKINAKVEINTIPRQMVIAQNGSYSFDAPSGKYTLKASMLERNNLASIEENITITRDGSYVLDLILFPEIDENIEDPDLEVGDAIITEDNRWIYPAIIPALVLVGIIFFIFRDRGASEKEDDATSQKLDDASLDDIIEIIKKEGGRTTQKDIRKQIALSESKISLMIAELEHRDIIEKIKKGRGNIIILKRK